MARCRAPYLKPGPAPLCRLRGRQHGASDAAAVRCPAPRPAPGHRDRGQAQAGPRAAARLQMQPGVPQAVGD